ncbi:MAG TPA: hypothetical protein VFG42_08880 [Baekduia sp.]|uniref:hypothetical protein n=1 Tax=Baekduia sp. TaxID=2600305 RepID=UPI002D76648E|nr:hypothetical protein [Baekduia sp.]HET6506891.1 hypothetical protein [Baekduia sp.]
MAGDPQFGPAPDPGAPPRAQTPPTTRDPVALREAVTASSAAGEEPGAIYARVLRPPLAEAEATSVAGGGGPIADERRALARSGAQAALAELVGRLPTTDEGLGRRAAVLVPAGVLGELDGQALADALDAGGWGVTAVALDQDAEAVVEAIGAARAEVVVAPAGDAAQVLASQRALSLLRRVTAPPLIVGVAFAAADHPSGMAADHVVGTTDALAPLLRRRMGRGGHGAVPWGVRLGRDGARLTVAPIGLLDPPSVARLREIVETRRTLYPRIVLDLRELMAADAEGLGALVAWDAERPWDPTVAALGDPRTVAALAEAGLADALPLAEPSRASCPGPRAPCPEPGPRR